MLRVTLLLALVLDVLFVSVTGPSPIYWAMVLLQLPLIIRGSQLFRSADADRKMLGWLTLVWALPPLSLLGWVVLPATYWALAE